MVGVALALALAITTALLLGFRTFGFERSLDGVDQANLVLGEILTAVVDDGSVDYARLRADGRIESVAATLASHGPLSEPERFGSRESKLAYYINAYNALVLALVDQAFPINSVHDVRGLIEPKAGFGFFYASFVELDGETTNLHWLENEQLRPFGDARVHAAINCASRSCPPLTTHVFAPDTLDSQLDEVTQQFVSDPRHVRFEPAESRLYLSAIFDWYQTDFETHVVDGEPAGSIEAFIRAFCQEGVASCAVEGQPERVFNEYDWSLNRTR